MVHLATWVKTYQKYIQVGCFIWGLSWIDRFEITNHGAGKWTKIFDVGPSDSYSKEFIDDSQINWNPLIVLKAWAPACVHWSIHGFFRIVDTLLRRRRSSGATKCNVGDGKCLRIWLTVEEQSSAFALWRRRNWSKSADEALCLWPNWTRTRSCLQGDFLCTKDWFQSGIGKSHVNDRTIPPHPLEFVDVSGTTQGTISIVTCCIWQDTCISSKARELIVCSYCKSRTWQLNSTFYFCSCPYIQASNCEVAAKTRIPLRSKLKHIPHFWNHPNVGWEQTWNLQGNHPGPKRLARLCPQVCCSHRAGWAFQSLRHLRVLAKSRHKSKYTVYQENLRGLQTTGISIHWVNYKHLQSVVTLWFSPHLKSRHFRAGTGHCKDHLHLHPCNVDPPPRQHLLLGSPTNVTFFKPKVKPPAGPKNCPAGIENKSPTMGALMQIESVMWYKLPSAKFFEDFQYMQCWLLMPTYRE